MPVGLRTAIVVPAGTVETSDADRAAANSVDRLLELAAAVEVAGFDGFFVRAEPEAAGTTGRDPFVLLGAISTRCPSLRLAAIIPSGSRSPGVLAKTVASLDVCSHGRAVHLLAPSAEAMAPYDELAEELEATRLMLRVPAPSFNGIHFRLRRAWNEPLAHRSVPTPVGLVVPLGDAPAGLVDGSDLVEQVAPLLAVAAKFCDLVVFEVGAVAGELAIARLEAATAALAVAIRGSGRDSDPPRRLLLLDAVPATAPDSSVLDYLAGECTKHFDGVLLGWGTQPAISLEALVSWRIAAETEAQGSGSPSSSAR